MFVLALVLLVLQQSLCNHVNHHVATKFESDFNDTRINFKIISTPSRLYYSRPLFQKVEKIAGGKYAEQGQFPFMAVVHRLLEHGAISQCGGTVISKRWVLTAAHCIAKTPQRFLVVFGVINKSGIGYDFTTGPGVSMLTSKVYVHPQYFHIMNDIGLIYMPSDIPYTRYIQPIRIAGINEAQETFDHMNAHVIGWGKDQQTATGTKALKYAIIPIIEKKECMRYWKADDRNICTVAASGQNACQGDSGGPLIVMKNNKPLQIGIVSYGDANCPSGRPGVYTRITTFSKWIEGITGIRF